MTAVRRGLVVLAVSTALGLLAWFAAELLADPTPVPMEPGLGQPAIVGARRTVLYLGIGTVIWLGWVVLTRLAGMVTRRR